MDNIQSIRPAFPAVTNHPPLASYNHVNLSTYLAPIEPTPSTHTFEAKSLTRCELLLRDQIEKMTLSQEQEKALFAIANLVEEQEFLSILFFIQKQKQNVEKLITLYENGYLTPTITFGDARESKRLSASESFLFAIHSALFYDIVSSSKSASGSIPFDFLNEKMLSLILKHLRAEDSSFAFRTPYLPKKHDELVRLLSNSKKAHASIQRHQIHTDPEKDGLCRLTDQLLAVADMLDIPKILQGATSQLLQELQEITSHQHFVQTFKENLPLLVRIDRSELRPILSHRIELCNSVEEFNNILGLATMIVGTSSGDHATRPLEAIEAMFPEIILPVKAAGTWVENLSGYSGGLNIIHSDRMKLSPTLLKDNPQLLTCMEKISSLSLAMPLITKVLALPSLNLSSRFTNLTTIELRFSCILTTFDYQKSQPFFADIRALPTLKCLKFHAMNESQDVLDTIEQFVNLEALELNISTRLTLKSLTTIIDKNPNLKNLKLCRCFSPLTEDPMPFINQIARLNDLEDLEIDVRIDEKMFGILKTMPSLKKIVVTEKARSRRIWDPYGATRDPWGHVGRINLPY